MDQGIGSVVRNSLTRSCLASLCDSKPMGDNRREAHQQNSRALLEFDPISGSVSLPVRIGLARLTEGKVLIERWKQEYNRFRLHNSLG